MNRVRIQRLVTAALLCALVFIAAWLAIPAGPMGNVNLGDAVILLGAWLLGGPWSVVAASVGACIADLANGYAVYAGATLVIKALLAVIALYASRLFLRLRLPRVLSLVLSALLAELVAVLGYLVFEAFFLGLGAGALLSIPFNALQGLVSTVVAALAYPLLAGAFFKKNKTE